MSTVSGLTSSSVAANTSTTRTRGAAGSDGDGDGDGGGRVHHGHRGQPPGGGGMARQLMAALQGQGLNVPAGGSTEKTDKSSTAATEDASTTDGSQASTLRQDLHEFMHQLFAAAHEAESASPAAGDAKGNSGNGIGYGRGGRPGFGQGLAALISEVGGGNAPAGLQSAFDKLAADLGVSSSTSSTSTSGDTSGTGTSSDASSTAVTLQALLTKLQGNLGYAAAGTTAGSTVSAAGNVVNSVA